MGDGEGLADHAADRQADELHLLDAQEIQRRSHVVGELRHGVVASDGIAAAMAAHVEAQHAVAGCKQPRHLLGPHAAVGRQRVREAHDLAVLGSLERVVEPPSVVIDEHDLAFPLLDFD